MSPQLSPPPEITEVTNTVSTRARQGHQRPRCWALGGESGPSRKHGLQLGNSCRWEGRPSFARRARSPRDAGDPDLCGISPFLNFSSQFQDTGWSVVCKSTCPPTDSCQDRVHRKEGGQRGEATHPKGVLDSTGVWPQGLCNPQAMMRGEVSGPWPLPLAPLGLYFFPPLCILTESISHALNTGNMI